MLIGCATAASLFPFVGTIIYMIVRPPEYLDDVRERELEMQAAEARLAELGYHLCPHCDYEVENSSQHPGARLAMFRRGISLDRNQQGIDSA